MPDFVIEHAKQSSLGAARRVCMQSLCEPESRLCVGATYAEGQTVEVHDGQQWVRGRVMKVHANDIVDVTLDHSPDSWAGYEMGFVRPLETLSSPALDEVQGAAAELALRHGAKQEETLRALASPPRRQRRAERALQQDVGPRWIVAIAEAVSSSCAPGLPRCWAHVHTGGARGCPWHEWRTHGRAEGPAASAAASPARLGIEQGSACCGSGGRIAATAAAAVAARAPAKQLTPPPTPQLDRALAALLVQRAA